MHEIDNKNNIVVLQPAEVWCKCGHCQDMPTKPEAICCIDHDISVKLHERDQEFKCITDHPGVLELLQDAPLELAWNNYLCYHSKYAVCIYVS
jgi:hypothetical protein